jgi:hypothetical protein
VRRKNDQVGEPPMAGERPSEEFVRHFSIVKKTADGPDRLTHALDEHPQLGVSLKRLGEIFRLVDYHRRYSRQRYIPKAPWGFREALKDFEERWMPAYNEWRDRMYTQALSQMSEEFLRHYDLMIQRTGDDPSAVEQLMTTDPEVDDACNELDEISAVLDKRRREFGRFIDRAPHEFCVALADVNERWAYAILLARARAIEL